MRTSKKFVAGVSAFIVAISSVAVTVSAVNTDDVTEGLTVSVSSVESVKAGEEFTVDVNVSNVPEGGIAGFEFAVEYDADSVEFVSIAENTALTGDASSEELDLVSDLGDTMVSGSEYSCFDYYVNEEAGKIACMWATGLENSEYWISKDGTVATVTFVAKEDIDVESVEVGVDAILDDGEVVFATVDADGNYAAYDGVSVADPITVGVTAKSEVGEGDGTTTSKPAETSEPVDTSASGDTSDTTTEEPGLGDSTDDTLLGDVNVDGKVDGRDLIQLKKYSLGLIDELSAQALKNADVTGDGSVDGRDLLKLKKYSLGLIETLG
jgi:hypothetical protein